MGVDLPSPLKDIKAIKLQFSNLLLATTNSVKHKSPRELAHMLSCYDSRFSAVTEDCKDTDDVITALIGNVTLLDYDLLQYIANAMNDDGLADNIKEYVALLESYLRWKTLSLHTYTVDKEIHIQREDSVIQLEKMLKKIHSHDIKVILPVS